MNDIRWRLRQTRAAPPGAAAVRTDRAGTYSAAIEQFESLLDSAAAASPAARPLPLFYALSQGGRAILAAHGLDGAWVTKGHGLHQGAVHEPILDTTIWVDDRNQGLFGAVSGIIGSCVFGARVELGQLWAALPGQAPPGPRRWTPALQVWPRIYSSNYLEHALGSMGRTTLLVPDDREVAELVAVLDDYPAARGAVLSEAAGQSPDNQTPFGHGVPLTWTDREGVTSYEDLLWRIPTYRFVQEHWLIPGIGASKSPMTPLMLWWALLFGLSLLARYQPAEWVAALDVNRSPMAVPMERLLSDAMESVPHLVLEAVMREPFLLTRR